MTRPYLGPFALIDRDTNDTPDEFLQRFQDEMNDENDIRYFFWVYEFYTDLPQIYFAFSKLISFASRSDFGSIVDRFVGICREYIHSHPNEIPNPSTPIIIDLEKLDGPSGNVNLTTAFNPNSPRHMLIETIDCMLSKLYHSPEYESKPMIELVTLVYEELEK